MTLKLKKIQNLFTKIQLEHNHYPGKQQTGRHGPVFFSSHIEKNSIIFDYVVVTYCNWSKNQVCWRIESFFLQLFWN